MATSRRGFPSKRDTALVLAACLVPVHVWSIVNLLREVPAWVLKMNSWELIGVISYTLAFALLESILFLAVLLLVAAVLPAQVFRDRFVAQGCLVALLTSAWAVAVHYGDKVIRPRGPGQFLLWVTLYLGSVVIFYVLVNRWKRLQGLLVAVAERLTVLSNVYVLLDLLGVIVVVVRNIQGSV